MKLSCVSPISNNGNPTAKFPGSILKINPPVLPVNWCVALFVAPLTHTVKATELFKRLTSRSCLAQKVPTRLSTPSRETPRTPKASPDPQHAAALVLWMERAGVFGDLPGQRRL